MANLNALPQVASFRMRLGAGLQTSQSLDITGRGAIAVDRMQALITVQPAADGSMPSASEIAQVERLVRLRLALDRNDRRVLTIGDVPVCTFQQLNGSAVPVPPFKLIGAEQPTVKVTVDPNIFQANIFTNYGEVSLEVIFWGQGAE